MGPGAMPPRSPKSGPEITEKLHTKMLHTGIFVTGGAYAPYAYLVCLRHWTAMMMLMLMMLASQWYFYTPGQCGNLHLQLIFSVIREQCC